MNKILICLLFLSTAHASSLEKLYGYLNGSFSSSNHSLYDSNFYDVTVRHCPVNIEGGDKNSKYLILKQSLSLFQESPYRVRLLELSIEDNIIKSKNYELVSDIDMTDACSKDLIPTFRREAFSSDPKCILSLYEDNFKFIGTTGVPGCISNRNGASFVSSDVEISETFFKSLDRGWDSQNNQIWGSKDGPYIFLKTSFENIYPNLSEIARMLVGVVSNQDQFSNDPKNFQYIRTKTCPIKIKNVPLENSLNLMTNQVIYYQGKAITRTSLYRVKPIEPLSTYSDPMIESFPISDNSFFDYCSDPTRWNLEHEIQLNEPACTITFFKGLIYGQPTYFGSTPSSGCPSSFRGSVRLDIDEEISFQEIKVWERWIDSRGNQTAGSTHGPYIYKKEENLNSEYIP